MNIQEQIKDNLSQMQTILETRAPGLPTLLQTIHRQLKQDPAIVTLLTDSECAILVEGLKEHTAVELACSAMKSKPKKALKATTVDDL